MIQKDTNNLNEQELLQQLNTIKSSIKLLQASSLEVFQSIEDQVQEIETTVNATFSRLEDTESGLG